MKQRCSWSMLIAITSGNLMLSFKSPNEAERDRNAVFLLNMNNLLIFQVFSAESSIMQHDTYRCLTFPPKLPQSLIRKTWRKCRRKKGGEQLSCSPPFSQIVGHVVRPYFIIQLYDTKEHFHHILVFQHKFQIPCVQFLITASPRQRPYCCSCGYPPGTGNRQ